MKKIIYSMMLLLPLVMVACLMNSTKEKEETKKTFAKFEPADGECLFFIGQDLTAVGGLDDYSDGYCDHFDVPAGVTVYSNLSPGAHVYGLNQKGNDGIKTVANWGAGDCCVQYYIDDPDFKNSILAIGLSMVDNEENVAIGEADYLIDELAHWIKGLGERPVFLRIGYEFDGWDWNHYNKSAYLKSWERIRHRFDSIGVNNVAYVWQSKGADSNLKILEEWYPGDDLVDWVGYSYFGQPDEVMLSFARNHDKPVFIAEATPVFQEGEKYFDTDLKKSDISKKAWDTWFTGFINTLNNNKDVVKAFSYINCDWPSTPMWIDNVTFQQVDSRIQVSEYISKHWEQEISQSRYIKPNEQLWTHLYNSNN